MFHKISAVMSGVCWDERQDGGGGKACTIVVAKVISVSTCWKNVARSVVVCLKRPLPKRRKRGLDSELRPKNAVTSSPFASFRFVSMHEHLALSMPSDKRTVVSSGCNAHNGFPTRLCRY